MYRIDTIIVSCCWYFCFGLDISNVLFFITLQKNKKIPAFLLPATCHHQRAEGTLVHYELLVKVGTLLKINC